MKRLALVLILVAVVAHADGLKPLRNAFLQNDGNMAGYAWTNGAFVGDGSGLTNLSLGGVSYSDFVNTSDRAGLLSNPGGLIGIGTNLPAAVGDGGATNITGGSANSYDAVTRTLTYNPGSVLLWSTSLTANASTVTVGGLSQAYRHLRIEASGRSTRANFNDGLVARINGDAGGNYDRTVVYGQNATALAATSTNLTSQQFGVLAATNVPVVYGWALGWIYDYATAGDQKRIRAHYGIHHDNTPANMLSVVNDGRWRGTAAVTSLTFFASAGDLIRSAGTQTTIRVYGEWP